MVLHQVQSGAISAILTEGFAKQTRAHRENGQKPGSTEIPATTRLDHQELHR